MSGVRQLNWTQNEAGSWWVRTETVGTYFVNKGRWWIKDVTQLIDAGSDDEAKRWAQIDFTMRVMWGIEEGAKLIPPGHIPMPTNAEEARAMALLGERWLKDNAPEAVDPCLWDCVDAPMEICPTSGKPCPSHAAPAPQTIAALSTPPAAPVRAFDQIVAARKAHVDAVAAYNARLELVRAERERGNWHIKMDREYDVMSEAQSAFIRTVQELADAALSASPSPVDSRDAPIERLVTPHSYAQEYEFRGDGGGYVPTDGERTMIEDAICGYLGELAEAHLAEAKEQQAE